MAAADEQELVEPALESAPTLAVPAALLAAPEPRREPAPAAFAPPSLNASPKALSSGAPNGAPAHAAPSMPLLEAPVSGRRARREQLGFGFVPSQRGALQAARAEILEILELLDREDAAAGRLRVWASTAKSPS